MRTSAVSLSALAGMCGLAVSVPALAQMGPSRPLDDALARVYPHVRPPAGGGGGGVTDAPTGPDVSVGELQVSDGGSSLNLTMSPQGSNTTYFGFSIGTTSCNLGTQNVEWQGSCATAGTNRKPTIPQNMFRLSTVNGATRFEQLGASWCKHAFTALTETACSTCNNQGGQVLGIGCSDPYTASRNGSQSNPSGSNGGTGPRYQINPFTGDYPWPLGTLQATTDTTSRRIRVLKSDMVVTNATSPTQYIGEAIYVTRDDARWGNGHNNATYRRMFCTNATSGSVTLEGTGAYNNGVHRQRPAIYAWQDYGKIAVSPGSPLDNTVVISEVSTGGVFNPPTLGQVANNVPTGDGWHIIGSQATDLGNGTFHYEYAVYNFNSDRMGGSFSVPLPAGATVTNVGWKGVDSHSGVPAEDATRNEPWDSSVSASAVTWSAHTPYAGHDYDGHVITNITTGNPSTITSASHGLTTGDLVLIRDTNATIGTSGCYTATSVNGAYYVTVIDANTFRVSPPTGTTVTVAGNTGTFGSVSTLGNGLRWGTLYNFRFDSNALPINNGLVTLGFYKQNMPGYPNSVMGTAWVPGSIPVPPCYANCDASSTPPVLNVGDFSCFLQKYAAGDPYANCDQSTTAPVLNVADFTCFLQNYANGCP